MAPPPELVALAADWRLQQQTVAARVTVIGRRLWRQVDGGSVLASFDGAVARPLLTALTAGQLAAASGAQDYVEAALDVQGVDPDPFGSVNGRALAGVASDGRDLGSLLRQPAQDTVGRLAAGVDVDEALASGLAQLERMLATQVADAARGAVSVGMANDRRVSGYVRMLTPPSCSRCAVLAGKFYGYNRGFKRHPRCDCVHIPAAEDAHDLRTDPHAYFNSLAPAEQDKVFTKAGAEAVRLGADPAQVVNARRGALGLTPASARLTDAERRALRGGGERGSLKTRRVNGRDVFVTTEGTTTRGVAGSRLGARVDGSKAAGGRYRRARTVRLMPESILDAAESREDAVRLLKRFGYIL